MKKYLFITVLCSVAIALFFVAQKQSSLNVLVSNNVEALSDNDTDYIEAKFGKLYRNTLCEYPTEYTPKSNIGFWYASKSKDMFYHPYCNDPEARLCANMERVNVYSPRYGIYCYTIEKE